MRSGRIVATDTRDLWAGLGASRRADERHQGVAAAARMDRTRCLQGNGCSTRPADRPRPSPAQRLAWLVAKSINTSNINARTSLSRLEIQDPCPGRGNELYPAHGDGSMQTPKSMAYLPANPLIAQSDKTVL